MASPTGRYLRPPRNCYGADIRYAADVSLAGKHKCEFGVLPAPGEVIKAWEPFRSRWGQNVTNNHSAAATIKGFDWLGQPLTETIANAASGVKAFAVVTSFGVAPAGSLVTGTRYGLPYVAKAQTITGLTVVAGASGAADRRGTFDWTADPNGTTKYEVEYEVDTAQPLYGLAA